MVCRSGRWSGWITTGPKTERFAAEFARYTGGRFAVPVSSATAGLHVALLALGIGPGDEVITTPMTFVATLNTIVHCGAVPVLADIDRATLNIRVEEVEKKITEDTEAAGRTVEAIRAVDPALLGGIVLQAGSYRVDASVRGRLERLRQTLVRS